MRGIRVTSLAMVCLLGAALGGCVSTPASDLGANSADSLALLPAARVGGNAHPVAPPAAAKPASDSDGVDMDAAVALAEGIPYVRSEPHKVPPFPLVLNQTVQRYVDAFVEHDAGIRESFRRSRPYLPAMMKVLENHDLPPELVYLSFAESSFSSKGAGPWQLSVATARRFNLKINRYVDER